MDVYRDADTVQRADIKALARDLLIKMVGTIGPGDNLREDWDQLLAGRAWDAAQAFYAHEEEVSK